MTRDTQREREREIEREREREERGRERRERERKEETIILFTCKEKGGRPLSYLLKGDFSYISCMNVRSDDVTS